MSLIELKGFLFDLIARTKPLLESLVVGALLASIEALYAAFDSGQVLSGRTIAVIVAGAVANYITSRIRRTYGQQMEGEAVRATLKAADARQQLHAVGLERDVANRVVEKQQARLDKLEGA